MTNAPHPGRFGHACRHVINVLSATAYSLRHLDLGEPLDPLEAAAIRGDEAEGEALLVRERLAADVGRQ
jgi:hypothetical protein